VILEETTVTGWVSNFQSPAENELIRPATLRDTRRASAEVIELELFTSAAIKRNPPKLMVLLNWRVTSKASAALTPPQGLELKAETEYEPLGTLLKVYCPDALVVVV